MQVVFESPEIVVVNKPAGMPCHPLHEMDERTALSEVVKRFPEIATVGLDAREGGLCHRIDNDTSGLLLFARTGAAYTLYREAFSQGKIKRIYLALIEGELDHDLVLEEPIAHHQKNKKKMVVVRPGIYYRGDPQAARTTVKPLKVLDEQTLVQVQIEGGRRHQIRVHCAQAGYPLSGDVLYGGKTFDGLPAQALHAWQLQLLDGKTVQTKQPWWAARF